LLAEVELMCDRVAIIHKGQLLREGTVAELISNRREMEFRVDDVRRASEIVHGYGLPLRVDSDRIWVSMEEDDAPPLIAALASNGVAVFHAQRRVETLEELFLQATGGETVG
jgi:ABC-2 type transport system ATP-binding protein